MFRAALAVAALSLSISCGKPSADGCPSSCVTWADCASCVPGRAGGYFACASNPGSCTTSSCAADCYDFSCFADCYDGAGGGNQRNCPPGTVCTEASCTSGVSDDGQGNDWVCYPGAP